MAENDHQIRVDDEIPADVLNSILAVQARQVNEFLNSILIARARQLAGRGMAPWQRTIETYFGSAQSRIEINESYAKTAEKLREQLPRLKDTRSLLPENTWPSIACPGFRMGLSRESDELTGCQHILAMKRDGGVVAAQVGGDVFVAPHYRRRGLASEIFLVDAILFGKGRLHGLLYSTSGYAAARASYQLGMKLGGVLVQVPRRTAAQQTSAISPEAK